MLMWIEFGLVCVSVALALTVPELGSKWFSRAEGAFSRLAQRKRLSIISVALLALLARAAILPILPEPEPSINDEFSFLLAADTFAHGRVTNPTHPLWVHFEAFHEIQRPTYASMYPPAQGLVLAFGQVLTGHPFVGVWLSMGLLCGAICWMLQGWVSPPWALLGGVLAVCHFGVFSYWANSYWGGAPAAIGGVLVLGALPRIKNSQRIGDAVVMGIGLAILANSRPYEGLIFSLPVAVALLLWLLRKDWPSFRVSFRRVLVPLALVIAFATLGTGYYFWRVTGNPMRMAYQVNRETYAVTPYFLWQSPKPEPAYHHQIMRGFYNHNELDFYSQNRSAVGIIALIIVKIVHLWFFYLGPVLTLPLFIAWIAAPRGFSWSHFDPGTRFLLLALLAFLMGLAIEVFFFPHYAAPATGLLLLLVMKAMTTVSSLKWRGRPTGVFLARSIPIVCLALVVLRAGASSLHLPITPDWPPAWYNSTTYKTERARTQKLLEAYPGQQLVLVRYAPHPKERYDWIFNRADINGAKIVWARDMGAAENQTLISYLKCRNVWLAELDENGVKLSPYSLLTEQSDTANLR